MQLRELSAACNILKNRTKHEQGRIYEEHQAPLPDHFRTRSERKYWGGHRPKASWTLAGVRHWPPPQEACTGALSQYTNFPSIWSHPLWCSSKVTRSRAWHLPLCFLLQGSKVFLSASSSPDDSPGGLSLSSQDLPPSPLPASGPPLDAFQDLPILCVLGSTEATLAHSWPLHMPPGIPLAELCATAARLVPWRTQTALRGLQGSAAPPSLASLPNLLGMCSASASRSLGNMSNRTGPRSEPW